MKSIYRILSVLLLICLLASCFSVVSFAANEPIITTDLQENITVRLYDELVLNIEAENADYFAWEKSDDAEEWEEIEDETSSSYTVDTEEEGVSYYRAIAKNDSSETYSKIARVGVLGEDYEDLNLDLIEDYSAVAGGVQVKQGSNPIVSVTLENSISWRRRFDWYIDGVLVRSVSYRANRGTETSTFDVNATDLGSHEVYVLVALNWDYYFESEHFTYTVIEKDSPTNSDSKIETESCDIVVSGADIHSQEMTEGDSADEICYTVYLESDTPSNSTLTLDFVPNPSFETYGIVYDELHHRPENYPVIALYEVQSNEDPDEGEEDDDEDLSLDQLVDNAIYDSNTFRSINISLENGAARKEFLIAYLTQEPDDMPERIVNKVSIQFLKAAESGVVTLTKANPVCGQFEIESNLYNSNKEAYLVLPYGTDTVETELTLSNAASVSLNGAEPVPTDSEGKVTLTLSAEGEGQNIITIYNESSQGSSYTIWALKQKYSEMPSEVIEYLCIGSQYTNVEGVGDYGVRGVRTLVGSNHDSAPAALSGPASLGNFGGYIIYKFDQPITDDPNNPYGIDFITFGNSVEGSNEFGEPGQVYVSEDGETWYALAGGMHYEDYADWTYEITYSKTEEGKTHWEDSQGRSADLLYYYPLAEKYPWHNFADGEENQITLSGIYFSPDGSVNEHGNIRPPFAGFGYADMGSRFTILKDEKYEDLTEEDLARNIGQNPYLPLQLNEYGRPTSAATDGMDLAWAVYEDGQPVSFPNGVHYVKIVTASNIVNGGIGEKSTEVNMVRIAQASDSEVGITAAPTKITVDGVDLELSAAQSVSENQFIFENVVVDGPFKVEVEAPEDAHIYINNNCASYANFDGMPTHKIVRVIVQQGEKEPAIYVINLSDTEPPIQASATLTLDANGGTVNGGATYTMNFDANMAGDPLPTPVAPNNSVEFAGWYAGLTPVDSIPAVVEDATFVAHWAPKQVVPDEETVGVSFRLIGSTRASGDVDLANGDTKGAEYVTWIATKPYTMSAGSTVADLIVRACNDAGLTQSNALGGYVSSVTAPASYGGYELKEFTNGPRSGWMYTIGEAGTQHPGRGVAEKVLSEGDVVILHYVNDYAWEVADWAALGGSGWPSLYGDDTQYLNGWMQAEDDDPPPYVPPETPTTPEEPKPVFEDVPEDAWFAEAVDWAVENGITTGTTATTFEPELDCTRAQVVTFLWRAAGEPKASAANPFTDVVEGSFYYDAVLWAVENGITTGTTATTFEPDAPCTRAQVVTFLWRAAGKPASGAANPFADVAEGAWYYDAVLWAAESGVTTGTSATTFAPDLNCTRAQVVTFLWREAK